MTLVNPTQFSDGTTHTAAQHNNPINDLADAINGNLEDENIKTGAAIDPMKLANSVAPFPVSKLASPGTLSATVATAQGTTTAYATDLATTGPSVTVTIGANGKALVSISAKMSQNTNTANAYMGIDVSGATTLAADLDRCISYQALTGMTGEYRSGSFMFEGLAAGSTTFKLKYGQGGGGTATYEYRRISVIPL